LEPRIKRNPARQQRAAAATSASGGPPKGVVPAVVKAVRLLDALAAAKDPLTLSQLAQQLKLPKSTVHALCATLAQMSLVKRFDNSTYDLGRHVMDWTNSLLKRTNLTVEFVRLWDALALLPEETSVLSILDGADVVDIACRNGTRPLGLDFRIGMRMPANCTATGKALLSTLSAERLRELEQSGGFRRLTPKSITDFDGLSAQLEQARRRGYAIDDEETRPGMFCVGAPVFDPFTGECVASVAVSLLKAAMDRQQKQLACTAVTRLAAELSKIIGPPGILHQ
jgi:DNA-binding IclR family transcriptional regulator